MNDSHIQAQAYGYFLAEAPELLQTIEQEILTLPNEHTTAKVHNLMRALHTLKGAAANVGLATIERISHDFEDVARVFYNLEVEIDASIQSLLLDGYSGLQECLDAQVLGKEIDEQAIVDRSAIAIDRLKSILGDWADVDVALPTAMELGFDIVASIFETTVEEQLEALSTIVTTKDLAQIEACLRLTTEMFIGLGESFELPGFVEIDRAIVTAIDLHPDRLESIAYIALTNLRQAQLEVLAGDRILGGSIRPDLLKFTQLSVEETSGETSSSELAELSELAEDWSLDIAPADEFADFAEDWTAPSTSQLTELTEDWSVDIAPSDEFAEFAEDWTVTEPILELAEIALDAPAAPAIPVMTEFDPIFATASGEAELAGFRTFLTSDKFRTRHGLSTETQDLFDRIVRLCWDWFHQEVHTPHSQLNLELLVTADGLADLDYLHHWVGLLLQGVSMPSDRASLHLYRQSCVYQVIYAVAKYLADTNPIHQVTPELLTQLRSHLQTTVVAYKQQPPVTLNERGWLDRIILPHHWTIPATNEDPLVTEIWGQPQTSQSLSSLTPGFTHDAQLQGAKIDRLQSLLIESHMRSLGQHQQLQDLSSDSHADELAELVAGAAQLSTDLGLALATASELYQVADGHQQFLSQIAAG
jgi:two-component system, chemotaxis family, sensor histidine kinase and response regulator PixL